MAKKKKRYSQYKRKNNKNKNRGYIKPQYRNRRKVTVDYGITSTTRYLSPGQTTPTPTPKVQPISNISGPKPKNVTEKQKTTPQKKQTKKTPYVSKKNNKDYTYNPRRGVYYKNSTIKRGEKAVAKINAQRKAKREELFKMNIIQHGTPTTFEQKYVMSQSRYTELNDIAFNPNSYHSEKELMTHVKSLEHRGTKQGQLEADKRFKKNLTTAINNTLGDSVDARTMKSLNWWLKNTSIDDFRKLYYKEDNFNFDYFYRLLYTLGKGETLGDIANETIDMLKANRQEKKGRK